MFCLLQEAAWDQSRHYRLPTLQLQVWERVCVNIRQKSFSIACLLGRKNSRSNYNAFKVLEIKPLCAPFLEQNELLNHLEEIFDTFHKFVQEISVFSFLKFFNFFLQRPRYVFL